LEELNIRYWNHGPHFQFNDSIVFITWRLAFTLPAHILALFKELSAMPNDPETILTKEQIEKSNAYLYKLFIDFDNELAAMPSVGFSLNEDKIAEIVTQSFHYFDSKRYELHAYCIMSNHVHLLLRALKNDSGEYNRIADIVQSLKRWTAREINRFRGKRGQVWNHYYFDRIIRDPENYENVVSYMLNNPVKAGLVNSHEKWRDSYFNASFMA